MPPNHNICLKLNQINPRPLQNELSNWSVFTKILYYVYCIQECVQGFEYSGKTTDGTRYMGMIVSKTMSTLLSSDIDLMWKIPDEWSLEEAATIPVVYGTVHKFVL